MKTVILGHLSKNKQEIINAKLENMGFSKELKKAMEDMKVLSEGFKAVVDNKVNEMETRYTGVNANMDNLRKRVEKYSDQLEKVRKSLAAILGTLSNSEKD
jgi:chromosome segregation ATPase